VFKDPNILALFAYLAGHAVHYLISRPLRIPAAVVAKTPALAAVNTLEDVLAPIAQAAVNAAILKQIGSPAPGVSDPESVRAEFAQAPGSQK
jgi:hypothetical protein